MMKSPSSLVKRVPAPPLLLVAAWLCFLYSSGSAKNLASGLDVSNDIPPINFAITSIDVKPGKDGFVKFDGSISGTADDTDAVFLTNVEEHGVRHSGMWPFRRTFTVFRGKNVKAAEFASAVRAEAVRLGRPGVLLFMHGFSAEPKAPFARARDYYANGGKALAIPIVWPSEGKLGAYAKDKGTMIAGASKALASLTQRFAEFQKEQSADGERLKVSLLSHSMGNFLLRKMAELYEGKPVFDHIFMVAADMAWDVFQRFPRAAVNRGTKIHPGEAIVGMIKKDGKAHVLWTRKDAALFFGMILFNSFERTLGRTGLANRNYLHQSLVDRLVEFNTGDFKGLLFAGGGHGYQSFPEAVEYYDKVMFGEN